MSASPQALAAVTAVKNRRRWGTHAAWRYAEKRGVPKHMYLFAMQVETRRQASTNHWPQGATMDNTAKAGHREVATDCHLHGEMCEALAALYHNSVRTTIASTEGQS